MAIDFPTSPVLGDTYQVGDRVWRWNGQAWELQRITLPVGPTGPTGPANGPAGPTGPTGSPGAGATGPTGPTGPIGTDLPRVATVAYAPALQIDWSLYDEVHVTLAGAVSFTFVNAPAGHKMVLVVKHPTGGGASITLPASTRLSTDLPSIAWSSVGSKKDRLGMIYDATDGKYDIVAFLAGF